VNAQFAIQENEIYVIEVNPRASRTIPFLAKATGVALAKVAARCMVGETLEKQGMLKERIPTFFTIKKPIFPFAKFPGVDPILGPEMRSTGEVMGIAPDFGEAFAKAWLGGDQEIPRSGCAFVSVRDADKQKIIPVVRSLIEHGFKILSTTGTLRVLEAAGIQCKHVNKVNEGRPHIVDMIKNDEIDFIINTTEGEQAIADSFTIRRSAVQHKICYTTTLAGGEAACRSISYPRISEVNCLQSLYEQF
jgi:carbamoyl-phosphate synthase large subunit